MLRKLMKYELKWTGRFLLPLYIILVLITLIGRLILSNVNFDTDVGELFVGITTLGYMFSIMAITFGTFIIIMVRFYKNLLTDEGYLSFTLPVKISTHLLAKTMIASLWTFLSIVMTFLSIGVLISGNIEISVGMAMSQVYDELYGVLGNGVGLFGIEMIVTFVVSSVLNVLYVYVSIAVGQVISKNKILGSVAAYVVISMVIQVATLIIMLPFGLLNMDNFVSGDLAGSIHILMLILIVFSVVTSVIFYYVTNRILSKKLNLE